MSAQEIIAELPKLKAEELRLLREKLAEMEARAHDERETDWSFVSARLESIWGIHETPGKPASAIVIADRR